MPTLTLTFKDNTIATYRIEEGQSMTIGRKASNNVPIENLAVSGHHAKIDSVGEGFLLTDLQSKNGSFVNKELVSSHWLKDGDNILIGKHTLIFTYDEGEKQPDEAAASMDQTMVMDTDKYRDMLAQAIPKGATAEVKEPVGMLSYLSGGEGEIKLVKKLTKIGKSDTCDIVIGGFMMGATAATISKRPQGYSLSYVGGMTKPKVNGETVKASVALEDFDEIEVGSVKLQFYTEK
jgi:pSer/pThr/pTyr-binding forkhead associated (FHA) protein